MARQGGKLGRKKEVLIVALLTSKTVVEAAQQTGVSVSTIMRWMREDKFRAAYQAAKDEVLRSVTTRLTVNSADAVESLAEISGDSDAPPGARVSASVNTIRLALDAHVIETLEERIRKLEAQSNEVA